MRMDDLKVIKATGQTSCCRHKPRLLSYGLTVYMVRLG